jgi:hypothetical protein
MLEVVILLLLELEVVAEAEAVVVGATCSLAIFQIHLLCLYIICHQIFFLMVVRWDMNLFLGLMELGHLIE